MKVRKYTLKENAQEKVGSHIRYSPVSNVVFVNKKDPELNNTEFNKYVFELQEEQGQKFSDAEIVCLRTFNI